MLFLQSDNIFYSLGPDGGISHLAIGDLDTAKVLTMTKNTATVVGTPGYMAPEILLGQKYSNEVDSMLFLIYELLISEYKLINFQIVWSLGMIMYELMTLQRPYSATSIFQVAQLVVKGELPTLSETAKIKYAGLIPLWEQCVRTEAELRPSPDQIKTTLYKLMNS